MGEIKNRSVRLDDENYGWLAGLPGRSLNDAIEKLRTTANGGTPFEKRDAIAEVLELVRSLPDATDIEEVLRRVIQEAGLDGPKRLVSQGPPVDLIPPRGGLRGTVSVDAEEKSATVNVVDRRPKNCRCRHCGKGFAGPRFTQICAECKSSGHTLSPAECPVCNEGTSI